MSQVILLTIGHDTFIVPAKPGVAGKLLELLSEAVPCRRDFNFKDPAIRSHYRIVPHRAQVGVEIVGRDQVHPPEPEDLKGDDVVDLKSLTGAVRLLEAPKGARR